MARAELDAKSEKKKENQTKQQTYETPAIRQGHPSTSIVSTQVQHSNHNYNDNDNDNDNGDAHLKLQPAWMVPLCRSKLKAG